MQIFNKSEFNVKNRTDIILLLVLIISASVGLYIRLKGLGKWPLALDEYYTVKSAENILKYGVPMWDSGGYYVRGILIKYITSLFFLSGFDAEYGSRLITVIANMLVIPPLFIISKKTAGKIFASVVIVVFCFSVWEVEFARFARMYSPLQMIFLWYIFFLYKNVIDNDNKSWKWLFILSFLSIFIHESGIFIAALNFFPFLWKQRIQFSKIIISVLILIISFYYLTFDFWNLNVQNVMPSDIVYKGTDFTHVGYLRMPDLLVNFISFQNIFGMLYILFSAAGLIITVKIFREREISILGKIILSISLLLIFIHQAALAVIIVMVGLLLDWINLSQIKNKTVKYLILIFVLITIYWISFILISDSWYTLFSDDIISSPLDIFKKAGLLLFNYPNNYYEFLMFYSAIPFFTLIILISFAICFYFAIKNYFDNSRAVRFILLVIIISFLMVTFVNTQLLETRYVFHIYPLLLMVPLIVIFKISFLIKNRKTAIAAFAVFTAGYLIISEDFDPEHLIKIDSREINFRMDYRKRLERHYYPRWDVEGVAGFVNKHAESEDIIIINEPVFSYYLRRVDYFFEDYRSGRFGAITTAGGKIERWTNSKLIYNISDLMELIESSGKRVYFIARNKVFFDDFPFYKNPKDNLFYKGKDGTLVFLFKPADRL